MREECHTEKLSAALTQAQLTIFFGTTVSRKAICDKDLTMVRIGIVGVGFMGMNVLPILGHISQANQQ